MADIPQTRPYNEALERRLLTISDTVEYWMDTHRPDVIAIERVFANQNANTAMAAPSPAEAPSATEIQLLTSRRVLGEALEKLDLDVAVEPVRLPLIGDFIARQYQSSKPGELASPWFGLSRFGWGGERVKIAQLEVPPEYIDVPLQMNVGEAGRYTLSDGEGRVLVQGRTGQDVASNGIKVRVEELNANPGMRFNVTRAA